MNPIFTFLGYRICCEVAGIPCVLLYDGRLARNVIMGAKGVDDSKMSKKTLKMGLVASNLVTRLWRLIEELILEGFKSYPVKSLDGTHLSTPSPASMDPESQISSMLSVLSSVSLTCPLCVFYIIFCDILFDKDLFSLRCTHRISRILSLNVDKLASQRHL